MWLPLPQKSKGFKKGESPYLEQFSKASRDLCWYLAHNALTEWGVVAEQQQQKKAHYYLWKQNWHLGMGSKKG